MRVNITQMATCADCRRAPAVTYWQAITGPRICLHCASIRRAVLDGMRASFAWLAA